MFRPELVSDGGGCGIRVYEILALGRFKQKPRFREDVMRRWKVRVGDGFPRSILETQNGGVKGVVMYGALELKTPSSCRIERKRYFWRETYMIGIEPMNAGRAMG